MKHRIDFYNEETVPVSWLVSITLDLLPGKGDIVYIDSPEIGECLGVVCKVIIDTRNDTFEVYLKDVESLQK
jgi:hypothetical protein